MNILAVTCMRNEGPYCLEWIAHHRALGFTDFLIYTHDCDDGADALLDLLPGVTHVRFDPVAGKSVQWRAMQLADAHPLMRGADWAMFFDCDEFLCLTAPFAGVRDLIASVAPETSAIALQWRLFGSSGHIDWTDGLTLDRFTQAAPEPFQLPAGHFFKSLFRPTKFQKLGVHRPKNKGQSLAVWSLGGSEAASSLFAADDKRINLFGLATAIPKARLNHYSTRSVAEFMIKRARGLPNRRSKTIDLSYWAERNFNAVENDDIAHLLPKTRASLAELTASTDVQNLLRQSIANHRAKFDEIMQDRASVMLFLHLSLLGSSAPPDPTMIKAHLGRLQNATKE